MRRKSKRIVAGAGLSAIAWRPTPPLVIGVVACSLGLLLVFGRDLRQWWAGHFQPRITFADGSTRKTSADSRTSSARPAVIFEGEVYRTESRLREMSAVALAASLTGVAATAEGRPVRDVNGLLRGVVARGLLPPGLTVAPEGAALLSEYGVLHLRLRLQPWAVEVLSLGRERRDGPALLLRVPDEANAQPNAPSRYFLSFTLSHIKIPEPFATPTAILACGWRADTFRPALPEGVNANELAHWAEAQSPKSQVAGQTSELPR